MSADHTYDVAILGAGFSGSILGMILAHQGIDVVLIDAQAHPRFAIGESTIPHTSLLLSVLAEKYGIPEIEHIAFPDRIAQHIAPTSGIKRAFGFAYHRKGQPHNPSEGLQFGTSSKDENHLFRQDVDSYLFETAVRYGVTPLLYTRITNINITPQGVTLESERQSPIRARYVVDGTGRNSPLVRHNNLLATPPGLRHQSRTLFTHMVDVHPFEADRQPFILPWEQNTLHHVFDGGWFWVIPFNNIAHSTNPLVSVGLTLDLRKYPASSLPPEQEFKQFLARFPSVAATFAQARAVRPWIGTGRIQHAAKQTTGYRYALMSHTAGFIDPLYSRGLINTIEIIYALLPPLLHALQSDDFAPEPFTRVDAIHKQLLRYNDQLVHASYKAWGNFDLWNAWLRVWALGTIIAEFRLMHALESYTASRDETHLQGDATNPVFSPFEDPDYAAYFRQALAVMTAYEEGLLPASQATTQLFALATPYPFPVLLTRAAMRRAGWLGSDETISDRNLQIARTGYRWALSNPTSRDLFGTAHTFYRWRLHRPDPFVTP